MIRNGPKPVLAIVQRRRDGAWVLPKGKLKPHEAPIAAAKREAIEETGCEVRVHEFLGVISYLGGNGPKIAHFWRMRALDGAPRKLMGDIKTVEWLPLSAAIERLTLPHEQIFLRNVGRQALRKSVEKARPKQQPRVPAQPPLDQVPAIRPPADARLGSRPRWSALARFAKRLQEALGRAE